MVKSSHFHYASHCLALHYDSDDVGFDNALAGDDDDTSDNDNNLPSPYILDLFFFFSIFHDAFPSDTIHSIRLIKHLDLLCGNDKEWKKIYNVIWLLFEK